jgi:hypothetical protein
LRWRRRSPSISAACPCRGDFQYGAPAGTTVLLIVDDQTAETVDLGDLARQQQW